MAPSGIASGKYCLRGKRWMSASSDHSNIDIINGVLPNYIKPLHIYNFPNGI